VVTLAIVTTGFIPLRNTQVFRALSGYIGASDKSTALGLKVQRAGNDWQLSWDPTSPFLRSAAAGRLLITDGLIHKSVDLNMSDLRSGTLMYTPISDDVFVEIEVVNSESATLASGSVHMAAGLQPPRLDMAQTIDGSPHRAVHPDGENFSALAPALGMGLSATRTATEGTSIAGSFPADAKFPLTMNPPVIAIRRESINPSAVETMPNVEMPSQAREILISPSSPPAPAELGPNPTISNSNLESSVRAPGAERPGAVIPAELISGKEPVYPEIAKSSQISGTVELQFRVSPKGNIEDVEVMKGPPVLASAAVEAVRGWRYKPALLKGIPVDSSVSATIFFKLN
jgi:TonB family protein